MIVHVKRALPVNDFQNGGTVFLKPGTYVLVQQPQPEGAKCGPILVVESRQVGAPKTWWEQLVQESPQLAARV